MAFSDRCRLVCGPRGWKSRVRAPPTACTIGFIARLSADRAGSTAVFLALSLSTVVGIAGLGTEAASWYFTKRAMQGAADAAASSAAAALGAGAPSSTLAAEAKNITAAYNFVDGGPGTTVTVNYPPASLNYQTVEVIITQRQNALLSALFSTATAGPTISARAVAQADTAKTGQGCVIALDPDNETSFTASGTAVLIFDACSLYINSPSASALSAGGSISAQSAYLVGGVSGSGLTTTQSPGLFTGVDPLTDPYLSAAVPTYSGYDVKSYHLSAKPDTINVGPSGVYVFRNGVTLDGGSALTLGAGTFIVDQGLLKITGGAALIAPSGTTIILTSSTPGNACATTKFDGGATVSITAPNSGALSGIAIYQDRACTDTTATNSLGGGATQNIVGALYFPGEPVSFSGGSATGGAACTQLVAWSISFTGASTFNSSCIGIGTRSVSLTGGHLIE